MPVELSYEKACLTAALSGEIDHHHARFLREQIDQALARFQPPALVLDFDAVTFLDSSAVGLVMGRFKALSAWEGALEVEGLSPAACRVMRLSNLHTLAKLKLKTEEKERAGV